METENNYMETDLGNVSPNPRGEYDEKASYEYLDLVSLQGGSYICLAELGTTISGTAPEPGENTDTWQMITLPGELTPEYIAMHDDTVGKAKQAEASRSAAELAQEAAETAQADVTQMHSETLQAATEASESRDSAAGYAQAAELSRKAASESEQNINAQVTGFDVQVVESIAQAKEQITSARQKAVQAVTSQQETSVQAVKDQTADYIENQKAIAKKEITTHTSNKIAEADEKLKASTNELGTAAEGASQTISRIKDATGTAEDSKKELDASIAEAEKAKTAVDESSKTASQTKTGLDAANNTASNLYVSLEKKITDGTQLKTDLQTTGETAVSNLQSEANKQIQNIIAAGGGIENALSNFFALHRNGKVFTTKIYKYEISTSPVGVKMNANENMVAEPSVGRKEGRDDYAQYGLFKHFTCNFSVDENGFNHVDCLEGQTGFSKTGKVQVGEVTMGAWFGVEDTADAVLYHYSDSQTELTPYPMKETINPDGTISPFMIHAKYAAGDIDGAPYSSKGLPPANGAQVTKNPISYTGMISYMHKLGKHYCGTTSWDLFYRQLMMIIKYGTTHSQSIMAGCTSYGTQNQNLVAESGVTRVILTKGQANAYAIGSYVSIGDIGNNTERDRYYEYMHNLAYSVKVIKIEDVDDNNAAVYVDAPQTFNTTLTTWIVTMPWHSGSTDEVAGSDGSPNSNTSGRDPYKIQGIEISIGAYEVLGNVVMDIVTGADGKPARDVYVCEDASVLSNNLDTVRTTYKKAAAQVAYTASDWKFITEEAMEPNLGIMIPTKVGGGSATGFADALYTDAGTSGSREWLALGSVNSGASAGLWLLLANTGWSGANWSIVSGVSPNGTRGEWQAEA